MIDLIYSLLLTHSAPTAVSPKLLAPAILKIAKKYDEDPILITQIIIVESKGKPNAYNPYTQDYGLMQIHLDTAIEHGLTEQCLYDWKCNLNAGVKILSKMRKSVDFQKCVWNTGLQGSKKYPKACAKYEWALANIGGLL